MIILPATVNDIINFTNNARPEDLIEIELYQGAPFQETLISNLKDTLVMTEGDTLIAIGGIQDNLIWMLCTKQVEEPLYAIKFLRKTKEALAQVLEHIPYLENWAWKENKLHIKWLRWMGATFGETKGEFIHFYLGSKEVTA